MPIPPPARRALILLLTLLLLAVTLGCSCGQILQDWLTQFLQDLTRTGPGGRAATTACFSTVTM